MRRPFIANMHLNELHKSEQDKYMAKKLGNAKPLVNAKCPESFTFYKLSFGRKQKPVNVVAEGPICQRA